MKKVTLLLFILLLLLFPTLFQIRPVYALSKGYERYKDDICEVYVSYMPEFVFDPDYPTASEEFAIMFYIMQDPFWMGLRKFVAGGFKIRVGYRDLTDGTLDWCSWGRWYPTSMRQNGLDLIWSLSVGVETLTTRVTVAVPDTYLFEQDYTEEEWVYNGVTYMFLGSLKLLYSSNIFWGQVSCEGGGDINIPNDLAMNKEGHHVEVLVEVKMHWISWIWTPVWTEKTIHFVLGDDNPSMTDCWLTVEEGSTEFTVSKPSNGNGGGGCPILSVYDGIEYIEEGSLNIHSVEDTVVYQDLTVTPEEMNQKYYLRLTEPNLPESHSYIDQVKLLAYSSGKTIRCPLISAEHSEDGNVLYDLLLSDDVRTDTEPYEYIDLTFVAPTGEIESLIFVIEGYNIKTPFP